MAALVDIVREARKRLPPWEEVAAEARERAEAIEIGKALRLELDRTGLRIPVFMGGRLNQAGDGTPLPVYVSSELVALGLIPCQSIPDLVCLERTRTTGLSGLVVTGRERTVPVCDGHGLCMRWAAGVAVRPAQSSAVSSSSETRCSLSRLSTRSVKRMPFR